MFSLKYWLRYILTLCLIAAIIFMMMCTVTVIYLIGKGDIKIRMIRDNRKKRSKRKWRKKECRCAILACLLI